MTRFEEERNKIREEFVSKYAVDDRAKQITLASFTADPIFEEEYLDAIKDDAYLWGLYERWITRISTPYPFPQDELYQLRKIVVAPLSLIEGKDVSPFHWHHCVNRPALFLLLDFLYPFLERLIHGGLVYYGLTQIVEDEEALSFLPHIVENAAVRALTICSEEEDKKEGYTEFVTSFLEKFKHSYFICLTVKFVELPSEDDPFKEKFEEEWGRLSHFSDLFYGFEVVPRIDPEDWFRYLRLPFECPSHRSLSKSPTYYQVLNFVVGIACFKPMPDTRIKAHYRNRLAELFLPLAKRLFEETRKKDVSRDYVSDEELKKIINDLINTYIKEFDFFYKSNKELEKGRVSGEGRLIAPISYGGGLAHLGDLPSVEEYPLPAYMETKLRTKMDEFFLKDSYSYNESLDDEFEDEEGGRLSRIDRFMADEYAGNTMPQYDYTNRRGERLGWTIRSFGGILGKSEATLRRWEREGLLVAHRGGSYKRGKHKYRYYTQEQISEARKIEGLKILKQHHKE